MFPGFSVHGPWVTYDPESDLEDLTRHAESIPGPSTDRLCGMAERLDLAIGAGIAERSLTRKPFNAYAIVGADGVLHVQRKLQPTLSEMDFYRGGGDEVNLFERGGLRLGVTICADNESPLIHDKPAGLGVQVIIEPHFDCIKTFQNVGGSWAEILAFNRDDTLQRRAEVLARRLGVFAIYVDAKDPREQFDERSGWPHRVTGKSAVFAPGGELIAENAGNEEVLVVVDLLAG